jgi:ornithine carbamoyltransferase
VLSRYADGVSGRNVAKDVLDELCLSDREPATQYRQNIAAVLQAIADAFGIKERR